MANLETLPSDIEDVTIEEYVEEEYSTEIEETILHFEGTDILLDAQGNYEQVIMAAPQLSLAAAPNVVHFSNNDFVYTIEFNNTSLRVLFPENMREYLVVRDNVLINTYGSSIVGLVLDNNDSSTIVSYHSRFLTLYPFTSTSGNTNAYRYGGYAYLTTYSPSTGQNLTSTTVYGNAIVTQEKPAFSGFTSFQLIMIICAALMVLISFFRGIRN